MSEFEELNNEPDGDEDVDADEQYLEYKAEQDEMNASDEFFQLYGFEHNCRCADDWAEGNLGLVSVCYLEMCREALDLLKTTRQEIADVKAENAQYRIQLIEAGIEVNGGN